jgi:hypothetical protein
MPQYAQPELAQANLLDARADHYYSLGETAANELLASSSVQAIGCLTD